MISVRESVADELAAFLAMEKQPHAKPYINEYTLDLHHQCFADADMVYLSIMHKEHELAGYFLLVREGDGSSFEFRRIVIDQDHRGIGQVAIGEMENYCQNVLHARRIWLDVYEDNAKGMHIYEKLGYQRFDQTEVDGRGLFFYDKTL